MGLSDLQTMAQVNAKPHAGQKGVPRFLSKEARDAEKTAAEDAFRDGVWLRDEGKSRASGRKLSRKAKGWDQRGEVHHKLKRSRAPERKHDISVALLLSKREHALAETVCLHAPQFFMLDIEGPEDCKMQQFFIWRDIDGNELRRAKG